MIEPPPLSPTIAPVALQPREAIHAVRKLEFRFVQLSATEPGLRPRDLDRSARRDLLALLRRLELSLSGLDFFIPPAHYLQPEHVDRATAAACSAIELAADLEHALLTVHLPKEIWVGDRREAASEVVDTIIRHGDRFGVAVADVAGSSCLIEGIGKAIDLAELSDSKSPLAHGIETPSSHRILSARCAGRSASGARVPLGSGSRVTAMDIQLALAAQAYWGPVVLDAQGWADPIAGFAQSQKAWLEASPPLPGL